MDYRINASIRGDTFKKKTGFTLDETILLYEIVYFFIHKITLLFIEVMIFQIFVFFIVYKSNLNTIFNPFQHSFRAINDFSFF